MAKSPTETSRRSFLQLAAIGAAGIPAAPMSLLAHERAAYPSDVGRKFYADGRVHPCPGNTIICHLPQQGEHAAVFDAMLDAYRDAPTHSFLHKIAVLPPSSYHMTVFNGVTDQSRKPGEWPADLPLDLPLDACGRAMIDRLRNFDPGITLPIRMRLDPVQDPLNGGAVIFRLQPFNDTENKKLRGLRDRLAEVLKIRSPGHETYQFHTSFGYKIGWLTDAEKRELEQTWHRWAAHIAEKSPEIVLGAPEYCTFEDMFAFHRQLYIGRNG